MKISSIIMIWVVTVSLVGGETLQATKWSNRGKSIVNRLADAGGMRRITTFFTKSADGSYSPFRKTIAMAALASTCWWGTVSMTGCGNTTYKHTTYVVDSSGNVIDSRYTEYTDNSGEWKTIGYVMGAGFVVACAIMYAYVYGATRARGISPNITHSGHYQPQAIINLDGIEQHRLARNNLFNHSMSFDNETYRGVLVTYRDGVDTRTGLAFSPNAPLVFSTQGSEQGMLAFLAEDPSFQPPEEITVKHPDGETPDAVISLTQVENVVLTEEPAPQELLLGE